MKKIIFIALASVLVLSLVLPMTVFAVPEGIPDDANRIFKFNIIGVKNPKDAELKDDNGSRIFVDLNEKSAIYLVESGTGEAPGTETGDFAILDANATDSDGALLAMPKPGYEPYIVSDAPAEGVWSDYSIYIRSLGKPDGYANITTCAELLDSDFGGLLSNKYANIVNKIIKNYEADPEWNDVDGDGIPAYASVEQVDQDITKRPKGKSVFTNVTAELTSIVFKVEVIIDPTPSEPDSGDEESYIEYVRVPIFDSAIEGEYWEYDNHGLKLLQVWIYDNSTNVTESDEGWNNEPAE